MALKEKKKTVSIALSMDYEVFEEVKRELLLKLVTGNLYSTVDDFTVALLQAIEREQADVHLYRREPVEKKKPRRKKRVGTES
jgi:hypothetical protein